MKWLLCVVLAVVLTGCVTYTGDEVKALQHSFDIVEREYEQLLEASDRYDESQKQRRRDLLRLHRDLLDSMEARFK